MKVDNKVIELILNEVKEYKHFYLILKTLVR